MKHKKIATLLALTLGGFGVHRFYLGQPRLGLFYLFFCWTLIPLLIGWIDGICFLTMSYARFNEKYSLKHRFAKKFENDEALHHANFETAREEELLKLVTEMKNKELLRNYLEKSKNEGNYLPRTVYARARAILEDKPWKI